ncbi:MAG: PaaI family thioesterase [Ilumatobacteraceae bacterium]
MSSSAADAPDPFHRQPPPDWDGGAELGPALAAVRGLLDAFAGSNPPAEVLTSMTNRFEDLRDELLTYACSERDILVGRRNDLPGRGNPLLPPFILHEQTETTVRATVRFGPFFLGGNAAAHGGTLPLLFDDVLGRMTNPMHLPPARTAFLKVDYRSITRLQRDITLVGRLDREDGRKLFVSGELLDGGTVCAECTALFVRLLPGQP